MFTGNTLFEREILPGSYTAMFFSTFIFHRQNWCSNRVARKIWIFIAFLLVFLTGQQGKPMGNQWKSRFFERHGLNTKNFDEKWKLRKKSQYSSPVKMSPESISNTSRTIRAVQTRLFSLGFLFHGFEIRRVPLDEILWNTVWVFPMLLRTVRKRLKHKKTQRWRPFGSYFYFLSLTSRTEVWILSFSWIKIRVNKRI